MLVVRREVSQQFYLYGGVSMAELSEVKKLVLSLSDREIIALLGLQNNMNRQSATPVKISACSLHFRRD